MNELILALVISVGINIIMFIPAFIFKTDKLTDISYAITFAVVAITSFFSKQFQIPSLILLFMVLAWAFRLGTYLFVRIQKTGRDKRFDGMRENFFKFGRFWLLQGITVSIILIPSSLFFGLKHENFSLLSILGLVIWIFGLTVETIADYQKFKFTQDPRNKGKWIEIGIWKYSRHPNYLVEIMNWLGIYIFTLSGLTPIRSAIGFISPLYIAVLIIFVSGIPLLEKSADKKWGDIKKYQEYKKKVGVLIPHL